MTPTVWFWLSVVILTILLYLPVGNLVWVVSVRYQQRKLNRELETHELQGQKRRARFIAFIVCPLFSYLFSLDLIGMPR